MTFAEAADTGGFTDLAGCTKRATDTGASYDRAALAELQREEVEVVNADLECEKREITPVEQVVRRQYEDDFRRAKPHAAGPGPSYWSIAR